MARKRRSDRQCASLGHHEEGAHGAVDGVEGPAHVVGSGEFGQIGLQFGAGHAGQDRDAHEEQARLGIAELLGLGDIAPAAGQCPRDGVDDAGPVRTGQREDEVLRVGRRGRGGRGGGRGHDRRIAAAGRSGAARGSCRTTGEEQGDLCRFVSLLRRVGRRHCRSLPCHPSGGYSIRQVRPLIRRIMATCPIAARCQDAGTEHPARRAASSFG